MSAEETKNTIIEQLIALDPTFKEKEADLHVLVSELHDKKPSVIVDEVFIKNLRARLIRLKGSRIPSPYSRTYWWATHLAPIGAIAILFLILMPNELKYTEQQIPAEEMYLETSIDTRNMDDASFKSMSADELSSPEMGDQFNTFAVPESDTDMKMRAQNYFSLPEQNPEAAIRVESATFSEPGYVVIHQFGQQGIGQVVGISSLQNTGTTVGITILLRTVSRPNETYFVGMYHDNGDGIFTLTKDSIVIDPLMGSPVSTIVSIVSTENY